MINRIIKAMINISIPEIVCKKPCAASLPIISVIRAVIDSRKTFTATAIGMADKKRTHRFGGSLCFVF